MHRQASTHHPRRPGPIVEQLEQANRFEQRGLGLLAPSCPRQRDPAAALHPGAIFRGVVGRPVVSACLIKVCECPLIGFDRFGVLALREIEVANPRVSHSERNRGLAGSRAPDGWTTGDRPAFA